MRHSVEHLASIRNKSELAVHVEQRASEKDIITIGRLDGDAVSLKTEIGMGVRGVGSGRENAREGEGVGEEAGAAFGPHAAKEFGDGGGGGGAGALARVGVDEAVPGDDVAGAHLVEGRRGLGQVAALGVHVDDAVR